MSEEIMLEQAFNAYLQFAKQELRPKQANSQHPLPFELLTNRYLELLHLVERLEKSSEFGELIQQTLVVFPRRNKTEPDSSQEERTSEMGNFFRRSECYSLIYGGTDVHAAPVFQKLMGEFQKEQILIRYLVPLRSMGFSDERLDFNRFQIRRFSAEELEEVLQSDVCEVFYKWSTVDVSEIEGYWFVDLTQAHTPSSHRGRIVGEVRKLSVRDEFSSFPVNLASALEPLLLYDWDSVEGSFSVDGSAALDMPFDLQIADNLLDTPRWTPEIPLFRVGVVEKGEEVDPPHYFVFVDEEETASLHSFITRMDSILTSAKSSKNEWYGLEVARLLFSKAYFSEGGIQQLLWNITVLEALLGEQKNDESIKSLLARRVSLILCTTDEERREMKACFTQIYDFRSRLVHGDKMLFKLEANEVHLRQARDLARRTCVWFLNYLAYVIDQSKNDTSLPTREELLGIIDLKDHSLPNNVWVNHSLESRTRIQHLRRVLPTDFPNTLSWYD